MLKKIIKCSVIILLFIHDNSYGNRPIRSIRYPSYSSNNNYFINFKPNSDFGEDGCGQAFSVQNQKEILWSVNWYAREVVLLNDGNKLIRLDPWRNYSDDLSDFAIAFYFKGKELSSYLVKDLVKKKKYISRIGLDYSWHAATSSVKTGLSQDENEYTLVTADKNVYVFDTNNGKIKHKFKDTKARTSRELNIEYVQNIKDLGEKLYNSSDKLKVYKKTFNLKNTSAYYRTVQHEYIEAGPWNGKWDGIFSLKKKIKKQFNYNIKIICRFEIDKNYKVITNITPDKILNAIKQINNNNLIRTLMQNNKINNILLNIGGNNLHWQTRMAKAYKNITDKNNIMLVPLDEWIEFSFEDENGWTSATFFYPINSDILFLNEWHGSQSFYPNYLFRDNNNSCIIINKNGKIIELK